MALEQAITKTGHLLKLARLYEYDRDNFLNIVDQYLYACMGAIDEFTLNEDQEVHLLKVAEWSGTELMKVHDQLGEGAEG